ncbi:MAG TPA: hypothetical protein VKW78_13270 [Terriglobales bacterium]|nr:hypothetical protein [Terriglobales bacterium]
MKLQCSLMSHGSNRLLDVYANKNRMLKGTAEQIRVVQKQRLQTLLCHAAERVPFYRERFRLGGIKSTDICAETLHQLPVLTRSDLQNPKNDLRATNWPAEHIIANSSGGSTGRPVTVLQDRRYRDELLATAWISDAMQGWRFGDRTALLWGSPKDQSRFHSFRSRLVMRVRGVRLYDAFAMSETTMSRYHRELQAYEPHVLIGYASALTMYAQFLRDSDAKPSYPLVSVISSAERLDDEQRRLIEQCFGVAVFDRYGSREVGCLASECMRAEGLHLHPLDHIVETVDAITGEPVHDRPGKVLVTCLTNFVMPLIRYEIGDLAVMSGEPCRCGFPSIRLRKVLGRTSDFIQSPSGRHIHGEYFTHAFYGMRTVRQFQFIQKSRTDFLLRIVKTRDFGQQELAMIVSEMERALGAAAKLRIEFPESIAPSPSGKHRFTISEHNCQ